MTENKQNLMEIINFLNGLKNKTEQIKAYQKIRTFYLYQNDIELNNLINFVNGNKFKIELKGGLKS